MQVLLEQIDARGVATLTLNRPARVNALDETLIAALSAALVRLDAQAGLRAVVLRGAGRGFCAGADLDWMRRMAGYDEADNLADARLLADMLHRLNGLRRPTIALVHGNAFGGGVGLAACCDIVIAAREARFCLSETRLGLTPATISPYVIAAIGARQARRFFITAEPIDAALALQIGLAHEVVDAGELDARCDAVVEAILAGQPGAQADAKRLVHEALYRSVDAALIEQTSLRIAQRRADPEARAAIGAFLGRS